MPKKIIIPKDAKHSGVVITWTPSAMRLDIGGWYDHYVGTEPESMNLKEFFNRLGIRKEHCLKALKERRGSHVKPWR